MNDVETVGPELERLLVGGAVPEFERSVEQGPESDSMPTGYQSVEGGESTGARGLLDEHEIEMLDRPVRAQVFFDGPAVACRLMLRASRADDRHVVVTRESRRNVPADGTFRSLLGRELVRANHDLAHERRARRPVKFHGLIVTPTRRVRC